MQNLSTTITNGKHTGNADGEGNASDEEEGCSLNVQTTGGQPSLSPEDSLSLIKIEKDMVRRLMVFDGMVVVQCNAINLWRIGSFKPLPANEAEELRDDDEIQTNVFFRILTRAAYEPFI